MPARKNPVRKSSTNKEHPFMPNLRQMLREYKKSMPAGDKHTWRKSPTGMKISHEQWLPREQLIRSITFKHEGSDIVISGSKMSRRHMGTYGEPISPRKIPVDKHKELMPLEVKNLFPRDKN